MYGESGSLVKPSIGPHDIMQRNSYIGSFVSRYYANGVIMTDHSPLIGVCTSIILSTSLARIKYYALICYTACYVENIC